jgi:hypothetical protein
MVRKVTEALIREARNNLAQLSAAKDAFEMATKFAKYQQSVATLRLVGQVIYSSKDDFESFRSGMEAKINSMQEEVWKGGDTN